MQSYPQPRWTTHSTFLSIALPIASRHSCPLYCLLLTYPSLPMRENLLETANWVLSSGMSPCNFFSDTSVTSSLGEGFILALLGLRFRIFLIFFACWLIMHLRLRRPETLAWIKSLQTSSDLAGSVIGFYLDMSFLLKHSGYLVEYYNKRTRSKAPGTRRHTLITCFLFIVSD